MTAPGTLENDLLTKQLVVVLGTGGVGKTTVAASLALEAAARGRRTLVLTIDPARRLADSLGIKLGSETVPVRENLDALMLDTKAALDALIRRYAPNQDTLRRIFQSRFYEQLSDAFAGSEEFVAMGTLHDLVVDQKYDLIVVDTPPSGHAIDFLRVNRKLIRVYESGVVRYLFKPTRFLRLGSGAMAKVLAKWTTSEYVAEFAEFMTTFDQMFADMEQRVRTMDAVLNDASRTSLNIVTTAEEESVQGTTRFYKQVRDDLALPVETVIVNRFYPRLPGMDVTRKLEANDFHGGALRRIRDATGATDAAARAFLGDAVGAATFYDTLAADHERYAARLRETIAASFRTVPAMASSVHDLDGLDRVRGALFADQPLR